MAFTLLHLRCPGVSEYNQIEYPVSYLMWTLFSVLLTALIIMFSSVFSKYLILIYLRSFLAVFASQINYAFGLPQGSQICVPTRGLIHGGFADIVFYQTYDKTWVSVKYTVKNPILKTVGTITVSAPIFGYFATNYDPVAHKYLAVNYLVNTKNGPEYKSPYSDYVITSKDVANGSLMKMMQTCILKEDWTILDNGNTSVTIPAGSWLILWYKDVGVPVAVCFQKEDGLLVIKGVKKGVPIVGG